jgi:4-hydroxy-3-methylbut-2-en-1-yl diphosphate reductase
MEKEIKKLPVYFVVQSKRSSLDMKIILAEHFGICFGVRDAIAQAERLAAEGPLTILGELVHNPIVRERLRARGIREAALDPTDLASDSKSKVGQENLTALSRQVSTRRVLITAHGASDARRAELRAAGLEIADGTCPLVQHAHEQLRRLVAAGFFPVVIGKQGHVEVAGLIGDFPEAVVLSSREDVAQLPTRHRYGIISQTTQPIDFVREMVDLVRRAHPASEVRFVDTVCKPTKDRQSALRGLIESADAIVVVGGRESNNTRQLVETCRRAGKMAFHIERANELLPQWFANVQTVGLTAGTSTLPETMQDVYERLQEISAAQINNKT